MMKAMKSIPMSFATATGLLVAGAAAACGVCVEDKVAATYDHAVIARANARHQQVMFVALDGPNVANAGARIAAAARAVRGVDAKTLRTSDSPAAFSIVIAQSEVPQRAVAALGDALRDPAMQLRLVRIMHDGTLIDPE